MTLLKPPLAGFLCGSGVLLRCWPKESGKPNAHAGSQRFWSTRHCQATFDFRNCLLQTRRSRLPWNVGNMPPISASRTPAIGHYEKVAVMNSSVVGSVALNRESGFMADTALFIISPPISATNASRVLRDGRRANLSLLRSPSPGMFRYTSRFGTNRSGRDGRHAGIRRNYVK